MNYTSDYLLSGVTVTTINTKRMLTFYNTLFNARLVPVPIGDFNFYEGRLGDLNLTLIPSAYNDASNANGHHQLSIEVKDIEAFIGKVEIFGGTKLEHIFHNEGDKYCGVADPDGNTIELVEKKAETQRTNLRH